MLVAAPQHHGFRGGVAKSAKDDACTEIRTRHPTDRGGDGTSDAAPRRRDGDDFAERRSRANSGGSVRTTNVYYRQTVASPDADTSRRAGRFSESSEDSPPMMSSSPFKRFAMLQRSFNKNESPEAKSPAGGRSSHHHPLNNFLDLFRHRSSSDGGAVKRAAAAAVSKKCRVTDSGADIATAMVDNDRSSASDRHKPASRRLEPLFVEIDNGSVMDGRFSSNGQRRTLMSSTRSGLNDRLSPLDEKDRFSPVMRKRSNSDNSTFCVLRKTSRPGGSELLGTLNTSNSKDDTYAQLLKTFSCYHLMPHQAAVIAFDASIKMREAFCALIDNGVRAALYWDCNLHKAVGVVTVTDLLYASTLGHRRSSSTESFSPEGALDSPLASSLSAAVEVCDCGGAFSPNSSYANYQRSHSRLCVPKRPWSFISIDGNADLLDAVKVLQLNNIHRLPVVDEESGNVLYFLTAKKILHFMYRQMCASSLPLPARMNVALDELPFLNGETTENGYDFAAVGRTTILQTAVDSLLDNNLSCLPVLDQESHAVVDMLTKVDIMNYVADFGWSDFSTKSVDDVLATRTHDMEPLLTFRRKTPLLVAIDGLVRENAHRITIVEQNGGLWSVVSIGSLLSYLAS